MLDPVSSNPMMVPAVVLDGVATMLRPAPGSYATSVPDLRQTMEGISPTLAHDPLKRADMGYPKISIYHPNLGPSAETTENALMARALMMPTYIHDSAATRMARLSNLFRDAPRFGNAVNICA